MATHTMRIAKAGKEDFNTTRDFLQNCEMFWDSRIYSSFSWHDIEDEREVELIAAIRKRLASEDGISSNEVDDRLIIYEFLRMKYRLCDCNWNRVVIAADVLIDNVCDPTEKHLAFYPGYELFHVAPEQ